MKWHQSFRTKLILTFFPMVAAVVIAAVWFSERRFSRLQQEVFNQQFQESIASFDESRTRRFEALSASLSELAALPAVRTALESGSQNDLRSLVLPALTVALGMSPPLVRSLREQLLEVLDADFVVTLRASRLPHWRINAHVLRNAAVPTVSLLGLNVAYLIGGTLVIEKVFAINGLGALLFSSISSRDFPVVQGIALVLALVVVAVSLLTEALVALLDPRIRAA